MSKPRTNEAWIEELKSPGDLQDAAIEDLRAILVRAAAYTFGRNLGDLETFSPEHVQQLAEDCAQEALLAILNNLAKFRGESKFTTWAYKFAINISLTTARRERWKGVSLDLLEEQSTQDGWLSEYLPMADPEGAAIRKEVRQIITETIQNELTEKQRLVLKLMVFDETPMDVVVEYLNTNRNAVYKLLHDARTKLKLSLQSHGIGAAETIDLFGAQG
jgi:RNA polymerase sigma-70 factor (ECF subfamily)